jgi:hypothetical protein
VKLQRDGEAAVRSAIAVIVILSLVVAFGGCDDNGSEGEATATSEATSAAEATSTTEATPAAGAFELPESAVSAPLDSPYAYNTADQTSLTPVAEQYPFPAGSVTAVWYQSGGLYVVYFEGFPVDEALCPGASIQLASGAFQNAANSPTADGACDDADTLKPPPTGVYLCGDEPLLLFLTEVPTSSEGLLYASTNLFHGDGTATGLLGSVQSDSASTPEVDLSACTPPLG